MKAGILLLFASLFLMTTSSRSQSVTPDSSFGTNGILTIPVNYDYLYTKRPLAQSSGKILVPYTAADDFGYQNQATIARSTANGTLDSSFGTNGKRAFGLAPATLTGVAVQADNRILVLYTSYNRGTDITSLYLERALPDGATDSSFARTGIITMSGEPGSVTASFITVKPDGHIIVSHTKGRTQYYTQLNTNGSVDKSFGTNGSIIGDSVYSLLPVGLTALPDNRIVVANEYKMGSDVYNNLYFYTADGKPDATAGNNGVVIIGRKRSGRYKNIDLQFFNHKLYVYASALRQDVLLRYNEDGSPDLSFGTGGKAVSMAATSSYVDRELDIQPDGKIIILLTGSGSYKRFNTDGSPDTAFGAGGTFTPVPESTGTDFRIIGGRLFISSLIFNNNFNADANLNAFKLEAAAPSGSSSLVAGISRVQVCPAMGVYPNPVHDVLHITGLAGNAQYRLVLTSQDGKTVATASARGTSYSLPVNALAKGIYYLRIVDGSGGSASFTIEKQ